MANHNTEREQGQSMKVRQIVAVVLLSLGVVWLGLLLALAIVTTAVSTNPIQSLVFLSPFYVGFTVGGLALILAGLRLRHQSTESWQTTRAGQSNKDLTEPQSMKIRQIITVIFWSLGGILILFVGLSVVLLFLGLDPIYDLWKTSLGLTYVEWVGGGVVLILAGSWINHKSTETLQPKESAKSA